MDATSTAKDKEIAEAVAKAVAAKDKEIAEAAAAKDKEIAEAVAAAVAEAVAAKDNAITEVEAAKDKELAEAKVRCAFYEVVVMWLRHEEAMALRRENRTCRSVLSMHA